MDRETKLVKRVQRVRRQIERADKLPRSQFRSSRLVKLRKKLTAAEAELATFRKARLPVGRRLALELANHKWSRFEFKSPTGGTARVGLIEYWQKGYAYVASPESADTGRKVAISEKLLRFLIEACDVAKGPLFINCIVNGDHEEDSAHYLGIAVDIDKASAITSGELQALCQKYGLYYLNEDQYHWHIALRAG